MIKALKKIFRKENKVSSWKSENWQEISERENILYIKIGNFTSRNIEQRNGLVNIVSKILNCPLDFQPYPENSNNGNIWILSPYYDKVYFNESATSILVLEGHQISKVGEWLNFKLQQTLVK